MSLSGSCRLFKLCRQGIYQQQTRDELRIQRLEAVKSMVIARRRDMPRLGTRKLYFLMKDELTRHDVKLGRDGLFNYLREQQMLVPPRRAYRKTTWSKHWMKKYPNLLRDLKVERPEQAWVSDITYLSSADNVYYLSLVTDVFSRKIIGYHVSADLHTESVVKALKMAIKSRKTKLPLLHHSDRGSQYCSILYQQLLKKNHIQSSMTEGVGDCYQNAIAERVNGILKDEFLPTDLLDPETLTTIVTESIKIYNDKRPHLSLNYLTPSYLHKQHSKPVNVF